MNTLRWRTLLTLVALTAVRARADPDHLPISLSTAKSPWKLLPLDRELPSGLRVEALLAARGTDARAIVISAPQTDDSRQATEAFALQIRDYLSHIPATNLIERDESKIGFPGLDQRFEVANPDTTLVCELFLFTSGQSRWGLLHWAPKSGTSAPVSLFDLLQKKAAVPDGVVSLPAFSVKEPAVCSFPVAFKVGENFLTGKIGRIVITDIVPDSELERAGIKAGDEIVSINGRPTRDFPGGSDQHSELGKIFLNRDSGSKVALEIASATSPKPILVTLISGGRSGASFR